MEKKGNMSVLASMKSRLHLLNQKPRGLSSEGHQPRAFSGALPIGKLVNFRSRRSEWEGHENSKEENCYRGYPGNTSTTSESSKQIKARSRSSSETPKKPKKAELSELPGSCSLLLLAIEAQERTTSTVRLLGNELQKKAEAIQAKVKLNMAFKDGKNPPNSSVVPKLYAGRSASFFENSYASCLDEIFQAWVNLMYLITNLKTGLIRVVEVSGKETFQPDAESEKAIITQATECLSILSQLKMKSLVEGVEEVNFIEDSKLKNLQILDFEERISSSFFSEMETLSKKAKEMMEHTRKTTPSEVN